MGDGHVAKLDNPAGRLHELLASFREFADDRTAVVEIWAAVFDVEDRPTALLRIAETAGLVPQIEAAIERTGDEGQITLFRQFSAAWAESVMYPQTNLYASPSNAMSNAISPSTLAVLGGVSSYLSATASEGAVPSSEEVASLYQQVMSLIDEIIADETLTEDIKRLALDHAYRLAQALDHFRIGGPGAVREATERLIGSVAMSTPPVEQSTVWRRVWDVFGRAWTIFNRAPQAQQALEAVPEIFKALPM
jgi:hypothetical protein